MKCPFCQQELECCGTYIDGTKKLWCDNCGLFGDNRLFEELIHAHKELEQSEFCCSEWEKQALDYKAENIALSGKLEIVVDKLKSIKTYYDDNYADPYFVNWHIVAQRLANDADDAIKVITALK